MTNAPLLSVETRGASPNELRTTARAQSGTTSRQGWPARLSIRIHAVRPLARTPLTRNAPSARNRSNDASFHAAGIAGKTRSACPQS